MCRDNNSKKLYRLQCMDPDPSSCSLREGHQEQQLNNTDYGQDKLAAIGNECHHSSLFEDPETISRHPRGQRTKRKHGKAKN
ncbi:hypothetical protein SARC_12724 [Sphaeroforma arctica JP610]|uniref:Uncharacterized protein n=1 Tax=Sphaeroforma arctica JP610 TaxID=667725 RepID=A0A0L0FDB0_9EUKA|nr:hypothetical protein SARC_12724 [Sphaeroforma arctica JP610]KNC74737.1 hypothetical protein SARC_12724 [Sphaeroforma arctica JP610]|eukprot:XP_014148639.1 hypothetical protein SARC_12724 [Sphaeroforma arctica JP610]